MTPAALDPQQWLSVSTAARLAGVSTRTIWRDIKAERVRYRRRLLPGRRLPRVFVSREVIVWYQRGVEDDSK